MLHLRPDDLEHSDQIRIVWVLVGVAYTLLWAENPKLHDIGDLVTSLDKYGLQRLPVYDPTIGIKAGNGTVESLYKMELSGRYQVPRGVAVEKETGAWAIPLIIGVTADNQAEAIAYALDDNNLTLAGGGFTALDVARMYNLVQYNMLLGLLVSEGEKTVTVDEDDLALLYDLQEENMAETAPLITCPECGHVIV